MHPVFRNKFIYASVLSVTASLAAYAATEFDVKHLNKKDEIFIEAANLDYDYKNNLVVAEGKVEVLKGQTVLFADKITYDQNTNVVTAVGNVVAAGADNLAVFSDSFVLSDDMKDGVIDFFRARLDDGSLMAAAQARRIDANKIELDKAVYSPCPICKADTPEGEDPQWQIKAEHVTMDDAEQQVSYEDAYFEVYGVPVFYTPYFSHPTPNADKKSGFLLPSYRSDQNLGVTVETPYYFNLAPDKDFTFSPRITSEEGIVFGGEYREQTEYGKYKISGSITRPSPLFQPGKNENGDEEYRGHLKGEGRFDLTDTWDIGFDAEAATDDTYLRRYKFSNTDLLTSRAYLERIHGRNYSSIQAVAFQGLLASDNSDTIPTATPYIKNHFETETNLLPDARLWSNISGFSVNRNTGSENSRASMESGVTIPYITKSGQILEAQASVRTDYYNQSGDALDTDETRFIPEVSVGWSMPLMGEAAGGKLIVQPEVKLITSPNKDYNAGIINEDSQDVEFSDLNIFNNNRFRGLDLVESGSRMHYGLRGGYFHDDYDVSYTIGQSYSVDEPKNLPANSGLDDNMSDIVGSIGLAAFENFDVSYRFRLDKDSLKIRRNEIDANVEVDRVKLNLNYLSLDYDFLNPADNREEISGNVKVKVADEWSVLAGGRRNLADKQNIDATFGIGYEGECASVTTFVSREFISDRDFEAGTSYGVQVGLKNLGEF